MIQINKNAEAVFESFGLTEEKCEFIDRQIIDIFSEWQSDCLKGSKLTTRDLLNEMMDFAVNDTEQVYIAFQFGRIQNEYLDGPKINLIDILSKL